MPFTPNNFNKYYQPQRVPLPLVHPHLICSQLPLPSLKMAPIDSKLNPSETALVLIEFQVLGGACKQPSSLCQVSLSATVATHAVCVETAQVS